MKGHINKDCGEKKIKNHLIARERPRKGARVCQLLSNYATGHLSNSYTHLNKPNTAIFG